MFISSALLYCNTVIPVSSELVGAVSKDVKCEEVEEGDAVYMVCKDKDGRVVMKKKMVAVG